MFKVDSFKANYLSLTFKENIFIGFIVLDLLLLLFLGRVYTKSALYPYLYYHDVILFTTFLFSLTFKSGFRLKSIEILCLISLVYLVISIIFKLHPDSNMYIYFRQFMVFGYLIQSYFIFKAVAGFKNGIQILIQVISVIAILATILQFVYIFYILFVFGENPFLKRNYFSPLTILAVISATSLCLTFLKGYKKTLLFLFLMVVSFSFGHDSAYLAVIIVFLFSYFINASLKAKILVSTIAVLSCTALWFFVARFTDINVQARLFYWDEVLNRILKDGSILYGNGFGKPYLYEEAAKKLNQIVFVFKNPESLYLIAPHNSFLTMLYHLGISALLLFYPLRRLFYTKWNLENHLVKYLLLSLIGLSIWASFNVILELPHSSSYFWLIYFTLSFYIFKHSYNDRKGDI